MTDSPRRGSPRRVQWAWTDTPDDELIEAGGGDGGALGALTKGPGGGSGGRGKKTALIVGGALALIALVAGVIVATLPNDGSRTTAEAGSGHPGTALRTSSQSFGAQPFSVDSATGTVSRSPSAAKTTPSIAPTHSTQPPQLPPPTEAQATHPATTATTAARATTAATKASTAAPPPAAANPAPSATVNVEIADSDDGLVLDVDNSGTSAGTLVGTWSTDNTAAQHWHLVLQPNGSYVIYTELMDMKEGLEMNTDANDFSGNTVTTLQAYDGGASMQWIAKYLGSGKYELINEYDGRCLQGAGQGVANATATCTSGDAHQAWTITG